MLKIGDKVPDVEIPNHDNVIVKLSDYRGKKVVMFAFPLAGTPECTKQACIYRDVYASFAANNTIVLGITGNPVNVLRKWRAHHNFPYDLLSDHEHRLLSQLGAWGQPLLAGIELPIAKRSYWVIDENGIIQDARINIDAEDSVQLSLAFVQQA